MNAVRRLNNYFGDHFRRRCLVDAQNALVIDGQSMPQPDLMLLRSNLDESRPPGPEDVLLLIEVADSSLIYDQTDKCEAYARSGIVEYWILDLTRNELHVFRNADGEVYRSVSVVRANEGIAPLAFPDQTVELKELLPP